MRSCVRGTKVAQPKYLTAGVGEAHFCFQVICCMSSKLNIHQQGGFGNRQIVGNICVYMPL